MNRQPYVAVVGGMNIDLQAKCYFPFRQGDSNPGTLSLSPGGVGRNIAENLARLGARVELLSVLGEDEFSGRLEDSCASIGIGLEACIRIEGGAASQYLCILDSDGSLAGAVAAMDSIDCLLPERLEEKSPLLDGAELIIIDANIPQASIHWLAARYPRRQARPLLGFDPVSAAKALRGRDSLPSFAFAKPNVAEARLLAGLEAGEPGGTDPGRLAAALRARGLGEAFVSKGPEGLWAEGPGPGGQAEAEPERWHARLPEKAALATLNSSGAGDAACAAIAWGLLGGLGLGERCALAAAAALIAAASTRVVNPDMGAELLLETAKGIDCERIS